MKEITDIELKEIQVSLLNAVDDICRKNNLKYSLCGGTLIGALRHKGFIPWDDDIDIFLPRPDYEKLIKLLMNNVKYNLLELRNTKDYYYMFAKLIDRRTILIEKDVVPIKELGVYIDIFPIDGLPSEIKEIKRHYRKLKIYMFLKNNSMKDWNKFIKHNFEEYIHFILKLPFTLIAKLHSASYREKQMIDLITKYPFEHSKKVGFILSNYALKEINDVSIFDDYIEVEFENRMYFAIKDYDKYLKQIYGNYMELPPKELQISHHNFEAYWKDDYERII